MLIHDAICHQSSLKKFDVLAPNFLFVVDYFFSTLFARQYFFSRAIHRDRSKRRNNNNLYEPLRLETFLLALSKRQVMFKLLLSYQFNLLTTSVTTLGDFWKFLRTKFLEKVAQIFSNIFRLLWKMALFRLNWCGYFLGNFWRKLGYF